MKLGVITCGSTAELAKAYIKQYVRKGDNTYYGHKGVTCSILRGMKKINAPCIFNPVHPSLWPSSVYIPFGYNALQEAIKRKQQGKIEKIIAGPNHVVTGVELATIPGIHYVDRYLLNSEWTKSLYANDFPDFADKFCIHAAGVDEEFWNPGTKDCTSKQVLLYCKTESQDFWDQVKQSISLAGYTPVSIKYGEYTAAQFKECLNSASFAIFISRSESQGIALAEAWSMNVPTLVWNPEVLMSSDCSSVKSSAAPYLTDQTGIFWKTIPELDQLLFEVKNNKNSFTPRKWILENMTDSCSARSLLQTFENIKN